MSSLCQICRASTRCSSRTLRRKAAVSSRSFSHTPTSYAASNFSMPSLSPTMTEGNIASWKLKEGDSFSAGDVILEIETDKATMDVEAQDDGILAKITMQDGSKGVKVGTRIAVLAEPGDDLSSLEIPAEESSSSSSVPSPSEEKSVPEPTKSKEPKPETSSKSSSQADQKAASSSTSSSSSISSSHGKPSNQKYPLYPSVQHLLNTNGISNSEASKIPATGPAGRLLKGDVLSYLGKIAKDYSSSQSDRLVKLSHLDLSNIKIRTPAPAKAADKPAAAAAQATPEEVATEIAVPISLAAVFATQKRIQDSLGLVLPLSTFIARASEIANEELPRAKGDAVSAEALFDAVLGLDKVKGHAVSRGHYIPQITALPPVGLAAGLSAATSARAAKKMDIFDILAGKKPTPTRAVVPRPVGAATGAAGATNVFSVSAKKGEEKRVRTYLERVKTVLEVEPGKCVL